MTLTTPYAVIRTGGKQYRVASGDTLRVATLPQTAGEEVTFSDVLLVKDGDKLQTGRPSIDGAAVKGKILRQFRDKKILVFKKRRKKGYKKLQGHRQDLTEVLIQSIQAGN